MTGIEPGRAVRPPGADLGEVRLQRAPLRLWRRAEAHNSELLREFALISASVDLARHSSVPERLLELVEALSARYAVAVATPDAERRAAVASGAAEADLTYVVPRDAGPAATELGRMLDEADQYCRNGTLLTLPCPPDVAAFQTWHCTQFAEQLAGAPPTPWPGPWT